MLGQRWGKLAVLVAGLGFACQGTAAGIDWIGTADYSAGPNGVTTGDSVADFHAYDLGPGVALLSNASGGSVLAPTVGDTINGYTQSYISDHLDIGGTPVLSPNLVTNGSSAGYELTFRADFTETVTSASSSSIDFTVDSGGSWEVYLDGTPDYSFSGDSGFTDDNAILSGTILSGAGNATIFGTTAVFGVSTIDLLVSSFDSAIFDPDTIQAGSSVFTLQLGLGSPVTATTVQGNAPGLGDLLLTADGNVEIKAVPVPAAVWLFGSGLLGLVGIARRRRS